MYSSKSRGGTRLLMALLLGLAAGSAAAQIPLEMQVAPFTVERPDGEPYVSPFSGGLFQPRIGLRDADRDGLPDLFTLNPDNQLRYYRNLGNLTFRRVYPSAYDRLPLRKWFRLADIDDDGDDDVLTSASLAQVLLYRNVGTQSAPAFAADPDTVRGADGVPIAVQQETVPSLVDMDGEGTLDLLVGNPTDGTITFYRNTGTRQAYRFTFVTSRFMDVSVISPGKIKKADGDLGSLTANELHGASVLGFGDVDSDADLDILFGDLFTRKLLRFRNTGTPTAPHFSMAALDTAFRPNGSDVESEGFNQAEVGDLDGDGDPDVLVSSLHPQSSAQPVILYLNTAPGQDPAMIRQQLDPTSEIDLGTYSAPAAIDDADRHGILVGTIDGAVVYFASRTENGRTIWREQSRAALPGIYQVVPAAADLDGDGRAEIVVGESEGTIRLYRYQGNALVQAPWQLDTFKVGQYASPTLVDLDRDGDYDLFLGGGNGRFVYFENTGSAGAPRFERRTPPEPFATLDVDNDAAPRFADLDGDGDPDAIVGGRSPSVKRTSLDTVRFFLNDGGRFTPSDAFPPRTLVRSPVPLVMALPEGLMLFLGNQAGGIVAGRLGVPSGVAAGSSPGAARIELPSVIGAGRRLELPVSWELPEARAELAICDMLGCEIARTTLEGLAGRTLISLPPLAAGSYVYRISAAGRRWSGRITAIR